MEKTTVRDISVTRHSGPTYTARHRDRKIQLDLVRYDLVVNVRMCYVPATYPDQIHLIRPKIRKSSISQLIQIQFGTRAKAIARTRRAPRNLGIKFLAGAGPPPILAGGII